MTSIPSLRAARAAMLSLALLLCGCGEMRAQVDPEIGAAVAAVNADASRTETNAVNGSIVNELRPVVWIVGIMAVCGSAALIVIVAVAVRYVTYTNAKHKYFQRQNGECAEKQK